jgi:hypothetical protein
MQPSVEKIRELSRRIANDFLGFGKSADLLEVCIRGHLERAFPEPQVPEGAVLVQYAIVLGNEGCSSYWPVNEAKDADDAIREAEACNPDDRITHRCVVAAWLPPVPAVPVVQGTVSPAPATGEEEKS